MAIEMIRKISPKTIVGRIEKPEKNTKIYTVYGKVTNVKTGESTYGPWLALVGEFEAVRESDGQVFVAPQAFLPEPVNGMIGNRFLGDSDTKLVEFVFDIYVKPSDRAGGTGYEYIARPIVEPHQSDSLTHLREKALSKPQEERNVKTENLKPSKVKK